MFDEHNVASSVCFFLLTSFISGTSAVIFLNVFFCSKIAASRTSFWARPLKTELAKLIFWRLLARSSFWKYFWLLSWRNACMATLVTTEKRLQVLKVIHIFVSFFSVVLTVRWSFCVSDLVREVSFFQRLRGKEEWNGPWEHSIRFCRYRHSSSDDENLFTNSDFCGIQTHDLCLVTGHHNLTKECNFQDEGFQMMHWISVCW